MERARPETAADLGLMEGFPPPPGKRVDRSNALMTPPFNRWSYQHMRSIYPSAAVATADVPTSLLVEPDPRIDAANIPRPDGSVASFSEFLEESYTDALLVVTPDRIVHESYLNGMHAGQPHQMMSATKSFAGLFALMAAHAGQVAETDLVRVLVPELSASTAFADATLGQVMDMVSSMEFLEDYADPASGIVRYGQTLGWLQAPADALPADNLYDFLVTLQKDPAVEHGEVFHYQTPKTDVVNWVTNRATGKSFQDNLHDLLWAGLGTAGETYVLLDRNGTLVAGGGLNACAPDLARFAMMMLNGGTAGGQRLVPGEVIELIAAGGSTAAFSAGPDAVGPFSGGDWSYRAQWWVRHTPGREAFTALGIHGQWIYIDRDRAVAVVKQSSQPVSLDEEMDQYVLNAIDEIVGAVGNG